MVRIRKSVSLGRNFFHLSRYLDSNLPDAIFINSLGINYDIFASSYNKWKNQLLEIDDENNPDIFQFVLPLNEQHLLMCLTEDMLEEANHWVDIHGCGIPCMLRQSILCRHRNEKNYRLHRSAKLIQMNSFNSRFHQLVSVN